MNRSGRFNLLLFVGSYLLIESVWMPAGYLWKRAAKAAHISSVVREQKYSLVVKANQSRKTTGHWSKIWKLLPRL